MQVTAIKTKLVKANDNLEQVIVQAIKTIPENSVLVVTSKIISICEGNIFDKNEIDKKELIKTEADLYIDSHSSKYDVTLTIKNNTLAASAGIDESNVKDSLVTLPKNPQSSAKQIWQFLKKQYNLKKIGVVITDSTSMPLKWGVVGRSLAYCGFKPLKNLIGKPDLYGRLLKMSQMNIAEGIAAAAVLEMGEADEQTPLALIQDIEHIEFQNQSPTQTELTNLKIELDDDLYAPILKKADWKHEKST